jgi:hypothetical protein
MASRILAAIAIAACGSKPPRDDGEAITPPAPTKPQLAAPVLDASNPVPVDAPNPGPVVASALPPVAVEVPTKPAPLQAWLVAGHYKTWTHESQPHESAGPHGDAVKTFVSPVLLASLQKGGAPHPAGASAVKELYDAGGKHTGWAVSVKLAADSANGKGWYWYGCSRR